MSARPSPLYPAALFGRLPSRIVRVTAAWLLAVVAGTSGVAQTNLSVAWQPVGPMNVASLAYGKVSGRVTSIAIDPSDTSGNTVYAGTTGGGVWKSINAAGPQSAVSFAPLTDDPAVFSGNAGSSAVPSLSIGAISVDQGVILAGTGDPNDALDSYYGGGILRSTDGGLSWSLIQQSLDGVNGNHLFRGLAFAGFAWSTASTGTVVAAVSQSAEGLLVNAADQTNSVMGLYYSTDAGATWQMSVIEDGTQIVQTPKPSGGNLGGVAATAVVWNPVRQMFYAAVRYHGYYQSADGVTWTRLQNQPGAGLTTTNCPVAPGTVGSVGCPIFRGALAVQPVSGDLFALTVDSSNLDQGLWQDVCAPVGAGCGNATVSFGTKLPSAAIEAGTGDATIAQGDYNLSLAASPAGSTGTAGDTLLYVGTVDLYRCSLVAGCVLRNTTNSLNGCGAPAQVSPSQHAITLMDAATAPLVYLGNDGGLWRSTDGVAEQGTTCSADDASHFQNLNGGIGSLAEVVSLAQDPTDPQTLLAGLGANGTAGTGAASSGAWTQLAAGEGGTVAIDQNNPLIWYLSTGAGVNIRQCTKGSSCSATDFAGASTIGATQVDADDSLIHAPWILDPALTSDLLIGTCRAWRGPADDGSLWTSSSLISTAFGGAQNASCGAANPVVRSLAAGGPVAAVGTPQQNAGSEVLYAGMAGLLDGGESLGGHIFSTTAAQVASGATAWTDLATSTVTNGNGVGFNPVGFDISSVVADPHDATGATVYATVMGFLRASGSGHIYRSTDYGAHWTNITANLPDAPANSAVVDPNDANTVYLGTDAGVYVTTAVTTCSSSINCWSAYGTALPNAPVTMLAAAAGMATGDGRLGELRAGTYGRGIWQIPLLTAASSVAPAMTLAPASLTFNAQAVATESTAQTVTVTNSGAAPLAVSSVITTGDFTETDTCSGTVVLVGQSCSVQVVFAPTATGTRTGVLTVYGNVPGGQATTALAGTATAAAAIVLDPVSLGFPTTTIGAASTAENITISNTSTGTIALQTISVSGDFKIAANTCGTSLAPQVGCTVAVVFSPTVSGTRAGLLTVNDGSGTQTATLSGTGVSPATDAISPLQLSFAAQPLTTASAPQQITLTNSGDLPLTLIGASTSGDFAVVNGCGNSLNGHSSCTMGVTFEPTGLGARAGTLTVSDQYRSQTVALSGTGIPAPGVSLAPIGPIAFPPTGVGSTSAAQTITLTNNLAAALAVQSFAVTGDFAVVPGGSTCGTTVVAYSSCTLQVAFSPTSAGPRTGSVTVTDGAASSPQTLALTGPGVDFTLAPDGSTTVTTTSGQNAVFPLLLSSPANVTGSVQLSCSGFPANSTCTITPSTVVLGGATTVSLTVLTGVSTTSTSSTHSRLLWLVMTFPIWLLARRRGSRRGVLRWTGAAILCLLITANGCGTGRIIPQSGDSGTGPTQPSGPATPSGTYNVTAAASYAGVTKSVNVTLVVQ